MDSGNGRYGKNIPVLEEAGKAARAGQRVLLLVPEQYSWKWKRRCGMRWMLLQHFESRFIALPVFATGFFGNWAAPLDRRHRRRPNI